MYAARALPPAHVLPPSAHTSLRIARPPFDSTGRKLPVRRQQAAHPLRVGGQLGLRLCWLWFELGSGKLLHIGGQNQLSGAHIGAIRSAASQRAPHRCCRGDRAVLPPPLPHLARPCQPPHLVATTRLGNNSSQWPTDYRAKKRALTPRYGKVNPRNCKLSRAYARFDCSLFRRFFDKRRRGPSLPLDPRQPAANGGGRRMGKMISVCVK